jgi:hypothetical protein
MDTPFAKPLGKEVIGAVMVYLPIAVCDRLVKEESEGEE